MDERSDLTERLLVLAETLEGDEWEHPLSAREDVLRAVERIKALERQRDYFRRYVTLYSEQSTHRGRTIHRLEARIRRLRRKSARQHEALRLYKQLSSFKHDQTIARQWIQNTGESRYDT